MVPPLSKHPILSTAELDRIHNVLTRAWTVSTRQTYGADLLVFYVFFNMKQIPKSRRGPASETSYSLFSLHVQVHTQVLPPKLFLWREGLTHTAWHVLVHERYTHVHCLACHRTSGSCLPCWVL